MYHDKNIKYQLRCSELSSRHCMVWYKFRHGNESMISWVEFGKVHKWRSRFGLYNKSACLCAAAVKVQKSNHHHWDPSSNYCHPPHASHSKTWSSPSHPHNQQDHCKCKLSLMTALLLARHRGRSLFLLLNLFQEVYSNTLTTFLSLAACSPWVYAAAVDMTKMSRLKCFVPAFWYV